MKFQILFISIVAQLIVWIRELLESVFHENSAHHHGEYEGSSSKFCDFAFDILSEMEFTQHHVGNILIDLDGDKAWSESYWTAYHRMAKGKESDMGFLAEHDVSIDEDVFVGGRYIDYFEKGKMFGKLLSVKVCMIGLDLNLQMKKVNYKLRARHK